MVDDGSTDGSLDLVKALANNDDRIIIVSQENSGVAEARKRGYQESSGEWIVFVDSDDILPKDSLEKLYSAYVFSGADVVTGGFLRRLVFFTQKRQGLPLSYTKSPVCHPSLFDEYYISFFGINLYPVSMWGKLYRRSLIEQANQHGDPFLSPRLHMGEDEAFNLNIFPFVGSLYGITEPVYTYRWGGLTSGYNRWLPELLDFADYRIGLLDKYGYTKGYIPLFIEYVNVIISHVKQSLRYGIMDVNEAVKWVETECSSRYLVSRMSRFFNQSQTSIPMKCDMVLNEDYSLLVKHAQKSANKGLLAVVLNMYVRLFKRGLPSRG